MGSLEIAVIEDSLYKDYFKSLLCTVVRALRQENFADVCSFSVEFRGTVKTRLNHHSFITTMKYNRNANKNASKI